MAKEIKEPQLFQFKRRGDSVAGRLLEIEHVTVQGKEIPRYVMEVITVEDDSSGDPAAGAATGDLIYVLGTADLQKKIRASHLGKTLALTYTDDARFSGQPTNQAAMRVFKVMEL